MKYFLLSLLIPLTLMLNAQDKSKGKGNSDQTTKTIEKYPKVKWRKKLKIARQKMADGSYINAVEYLEDVYKDKSDKVEVMHLLGDANRYLRDYESAEKYYKAAVTKDPVAYPTDQYYLALMQKMNGKYEDAKKTFQDYLKSKLDKGDLNLKPMAKIEIEGCDSALLLLKEPSKIRVTKTEGSVNTTLNDYSPKVLKNGGIMFASQKTDTAVDNSISKADYYTSLFTAEKTGKTYSNRTIMPYPPNDHHLNVNNGVLTGDENTLYFASCNDSLEIGNIGRCKLYRTTKKNALEWNTPEELKSVNVEGFTSTQPALGIDADGSNILYFASDRKGAKGLDLYYAKIGSDGKLGSPVSLGQPVNTIGDEMSPYYDITSKTLYFSSNGHPSIGGYDVFKVTGTPGHWGKVVNAG
ncbi:MAG TPA: hypothetical protein VG603_15870, partial [Chitinophagales bacterium]|nr:hypothetical protein [Chitinophagales bacterium]